MWPFGKKSVHKFEFCQKWGVNPFEMCKEKQSTFLSKGYNAKPFVKLIYVMVIAGRFQDVPEMEMFY